MADIITIDPRDIRTVQWQKGTDAALDAFAQAARQKLGRIAKLCGASLIEDVPPEQHGNDVHLAFLAGADYSNEKQTSSRTPGGNGPNKKSARVHLLDKLLNPPSEKLFVRVRDLTFSGIFKPEVMVRISPADNHQPK